eukprot:COSAG03_NODE_17564_length_372_cov_2.351648_1_plen_50_part_01
MYQTDEWVTLVELVLARRLNRGVRQHHTMMMPEMMRKMTAPHALTSALGS